MNSDWPLVTESAAVTGRDERRREVRRNKRADPTSARTAPRRVSTLLKSYSAKVCSCLCFKSGTRAFVALWNMIMTLSCTNLYVSKYYNIIFYSSFSTCFFRFLYISCSLCLWFCTIKFFVVKINLVLIYFNNLWFFLIRPKLKNCRKNSLDGFLISLFLV